MIPLEGLILLHFNKYDNKTILETAKIYEKWSFVKCDC